MMMMVMVKAAAAAAAASAKDNHTSTKHIAALKSEAKFITRGQDVRLLLLPLVVTMVE